MLPHTFSIVRSTSLIIPVETVSILSFILLSSQRSFLSGGLRKAALAINQPIMAHLNHAFESLSLLVHVTPFCWTHRQNRSGCFGYICTTCVSLPKTAKIGFPLAIICLFCRYPVKRALAQLSIRSGTIVRVRLKILLNYVTL